MQNYPDFNSIGNSQSLIQQGYESVQSWVKWLDERGTAAVCDACDQFAGMIGACLGSIGGAKDAVMAKVDGLMAKPSTPTEPALSVRKAQTPAVEKSPTPELGQFARMQIGSPGFQMAEASYDPSPCHTPNAYGMNTGVGFAMSV